MKNRCIIVIIFIGLVLRLIFFGGILFNYGEKAFYPDVTEDAAQYLNLAKNILNHGFFARESQPPYSIEVFRTPGYPIFVALGLLLFKSLPLFILIQNLFWLLTVYLVFNLSVLIFKEKKIGYISAAILSFDPTIIFWNNQLTTETFFTFLLILSTYFLFLFFQDSRWSRLLLSAFCLGWANITRPIGQYLGLFFILSVIVIGVRYIKNKKSLIFGAIIFFIVLNFISLPVVVRNKILFRSYLLSNVLSVGFGKYVSAIDRNLGVDTPESTGDSPLLRSESRQRLFFQRVMEHPVIFLKVHLLATGPFFISDGYVNTLDYFYPNFFGVQKNTDWQGTAGELINFLSGRSGIDGAIFWVGKTIWLIIFFGFLVGAVWLLRDKDKRWPGIFIVLVVYYFFLASGVGSYSRFRFPVNPFMVMVFAYGALNLYAATCNYAKNRSR